LWAGEECFNRAEAIFLEAEDGVNAGFGMPMEQGVRKVSSVVDDNIIGLENLQVAHGAEPFIGMGDEVEIEGHLGSELIEATEQT